MFVLLLFLLLLTESLNSFYLPAEYHQHRIKRQELIELVKTYLKQYGYNENVPLCPNKNQTITCAKDNPNPPVVTEEEALKKFQEYAGLNKTGKIDDATIEMMNKPRCGNSDAKKIIKNDFLPLKGKWILYTFLNFTDNIEKQTIRYKMMQAFSTWEMVTPLKFFETQIIEKADIKILFAKGDHGDGDPFDGAPGGVIAHGFPDGRMHFDDDENWKTYSKNDEPQYDQKDILWAAVHKIGHVLGLLHTGKEDSLMLPFYSNPVKRNSEDRSYVFPQLIFNDVENVQKIYGKRISKAGINKLTSATECNEYCFI